MPIEAIFRGGGVSQRPVSPSIVWASRPNGASVPMSACLEVAAVLLHVLPVAGQVEDRVADELAGRVVGRLAAAVGLDELDLSVVGQVELALLGAAPERDDGRMLEQTTVSGILPCRTACASERWSSKASRYGVTPRFRR